MARRAEGELQLASASTELREIEAEVRGRQATGRVADTIIDGLRETASEVVSTKLLRAVPLLKRIYARIDPHPAFRDIGLRMWVHYGRGRLAITLHDAVADRSVESPLSVLSSSQMNALAVSIFLALNLGVKTLPLGAIILDDPLQSLDDVNLLGLIDLLRRAREKRQLLVSTHDPRFSALLERKLRPVMEEQKTRLIRLESWDRRGPVVRQTDVAREGRPLRMVAVA